MNNETCWYTLFGAWLISLTATSGSLFYSEIMEFIPCSMCWYQRIAMYPLTIIFLVGLFPLSRHVLKFSLPLVIAGWLLAFWHNLLTWGILSDSLSPCVQGIPCSATYVEYFGFITIPLMSLTAFSLIGLFLYYFQRNLKNEK